MFDKPLTTIGNPMAKPRIWPQMEVCHFLKYASIARMALIQGIKNYKALIGLSIFLLTCLLIFANLWKVVAARAGATFLLQEKLLWYIAFNEWVLIAVPEICYDVEYDLKTGRLAYLLPRPISYVGAKFAEGFGALLLNLTVLGIVTFAFTLYYSGSLPFHPFAFALSIFVGLLAGVVALLFQLAIGLSSFWLHEVGPFYWIWEKLLFVCGGLILPLAAYPLWLQRIASWTPFPALFGERSALALTFDSYHFFSLLLNLLLWFTLALALVLFLFKRGIKIVNVEGG
jgi:ABC-2 type transport system permease protein